MKSETKSKPKSCQKFRNENLSMLRSWHHRLLWAVLFLNWSFLPRLLNTTHINTTKIHSVFLLKNPIEKSKTSLDYVLWWVLWWVMNKEQSLDPRKLWHKKLRSPKMISRFSSIRMQKSERGFDFSDWRDFEEKEVWFLILNLVLYFLL